MRTTLGVPIVLAAVLAATPPARADYAPVSLGRRIAEADAIAVGRIAELDDESYSFAIEKWIHGESRPPTLRVKRFRDWTCAVRPVPYAEGQRMLVFLDRDREGWSTIGAGCEGEALLAEGKASVIHAPFGPENGVYPEEEFVAAVASYRALHRAPGTEGWVEAWHRLLAHPSRLVVTAAVDEVRDTGLTGGGRGGAPGTALRGALWAILESGPADARARIARHPAWCFGAGAKDLLAPRLQGIARDGRGAAGLAARLAMASFEPTGRRISAALLSLGDAEVPVEDRRAAAQMFAFYTWRPAFKDPLPAVAAAAARTLRAETDAEVLRRVLHWLADNFGGDQVPWREDPAPFRERWLPRLDAAAAEAPAGPAEADADDALLPPAQAAVAIPEGVPVHERGAVAWVVRAIRRGRNAEAAGDPATARREYGTALAELFGGVETAARALGADPAAARERLEALETR